MELREYQSEIYNGVIREFLNGHKRVLVVAPCGAGKSFLFAAMCAGAAQKNNSVLVLAHRHELIDQHVALFEKLSIPMDNIRIESVFTEVHHLGEHGKPSLIVVDEAHLSHAKSWQKIIEYYDTYVIGFSGTPCRLDGKPLGDIYETMVESVSVAWLIDNHYLAPYKYYAPMTVDTSGLSVVCGDYKAVDLDKLMRDRKIYGDVIENYRKFANGLKTIVYCTSIKHAQDVAAEFNANGFRAESIDSTVNTKERARTMDAFRRGDITILCNCGIISEGISIDDCAAVMLLRPTESLALNTQQSMRCMRYAPNKTAVIIDCVGNYVRHGLPDTEHEWSLSAAPKKRRVIDEKCNLTIRVCGKCFRPFKTANICPWCGAKYELAREEISARRDVELQEIRAAEMERISEEKRRLRIEQGKCKTVDELVNLFVSRGASRGAAWYRAKMIINGRNRR